MGAAPAQLFDRVAGLDPPPGAATVQRDFLDAACAANRVATLSALKESAVG
jgi:hypothetical protein